MRIAIIGAGPCGLGAAWRLNELGHSDWVLLEQAPDPGGLASSFEKDGFTWDIGGHVQFSHYEYFDKVMDSLNIEWNQIQRSAWAKIGENWVPYPVQNNLHRLRADQQVDVLLDMIEAHSRPMLVEAHSREMLVGNFKDWMLSAFGSEFCEVFMRQYNEKVWAHPLDQMSTKWMGERVAIPDIRKVLTAMVTRQDQVSWGPNNTFRYPKRGGTGAIWLAVASKFPFIVERKYGQSYKQRLTQLANLIGCDQLAVSTQTGVRIVDAVISTIPITETCRLIGMKPARLSYSSTHAVGIGIRGECPEHLRDKSWMYFPGDNCPFYRVTVLSNYGDMAPEGCYSLLCEVAESKYRPVNAREIIIDTLHGLFNTKLIPSDSCVVSTWHKRVEHGYPTPTLARDSQWAIANERLEQLGIYSRGRFGAWKYEVSNQDHSFMQGVEIIDRLLLGKEEKTLKNPSGVNGSYVRME